MRRLVLASAALAALALNATPQTADSSVNPDEIIRKFAAREAEFRKAREAYTLPAVREDGRTR